MTNRPDAVHLGLITIMVSEYDPAISLFVDVPGFELVEDSPALTGCLGEDTQQGRTRAPPFGLRGHWPGPCLQARPGDGTISGP